MYENVVYRCGKTLRRGFFQYVRETVGRGRLLRERSGTLSYLVFGVKRFWRVFAAGTCEAYVRSF